MAGTCIDYVLYGATLCVMWNMLTHIIPKCAFVASMPFFVCFLARVQSHLCFVAPMFLISSLTGFVGGEMIGASVANEVIAALQL